MRNLLFILLAAFFLTACQSNAGPDSNAVTVTVEEAHAELVQMVAYQDGSEDWQTLSADSNQYKFEVNDESGRYGVAVVCHHPDAPWGETLAPTIVHATLDEMRELALYCPIATIDEEMPESGATTTITGRVINADEVDKDIMVTNGMFGAFADATNSYRFEIEDVSEGTHDLFAATEDENANIDRLVLVRNVNPDNEIEIDFSGNLAPEVHKLTVHGLTPGAGYSVESILQTRNNAFAAFTMEFDEATADSFTTEYQTLPASFLADGDAQWLYVDADDEYGQFRTVHRYFAKGEDLEVSLPTGNLEAAAVPTETGAYPRYQLSWKNVDAGLMGLYLTYGTEELMTDWAVTVTSGWQTDSSYTLPDFSDLQGWNDEWNPGDSEVMGAGAFVNAYFNPPQEALDYELYWGDISADKEIEFKYLSAMIEIE